MTGTPESYAWTYEYDENARITKKAVPSGRVITTPRDDSNGKLAALVLYDGATPLTRFVYAYNTGGRMTRATNSLGVHTDFLYDDQGLMTKKVQDPGGLAITTTWAWDYDHFSVLTRLVNAAGTASATTNDYLYDGSGYLTKQIDDPAGLAVAESYLVDAIGRTTLRRRRPRLDLEELLQRRGQGHQVGGPHR